MRTKRVRTRAGKRMARPKRRRLDYELVEQGLFASVDAAMRAVLAGEVSTSDRRLTAPGTMVKPGIFLHVKGHVPYVSRGGLKLEHGLRSFGVDPSGLDCLDVGCSTGGFTDCLLRHGASSVLAVDVGYAQFDWSLRQDARQLPDAAKRDPSGRRHESRRVLVEEGRLRHRDLRVPQLRRIQRRQVLRPRRLPDDR